MPPLRFVGLDALNVVLSLALLDVTSKPAIPSSSVFVHTYFARIHEARGYGDLLLPLVEGGELLRRFRHHGRIHNDLPPVGPPLLAKTSLRKVREMLDGPEGVDSTYPWRTQAGRGA